MSGDSSTGDIQIPSVFMLSADGVRLRELVTSSYGEEVIVLLTWIRKEGEEGEEGEGSGGGQGSQGTSEDSQQQSPPQHTSPEENSNH